jgi:hypothetical protein
MGAGMGHGKEVDTNEEEEEEAWSNSLVGCRVGSSPRHAFANSSPDLREDAEDMWREGEIPLVSRILSMLGKGNPSCLIKTDYNDGSIMMVLSIMTGRMTVKTKKKEQLTVIEVNDSRTGVGTKDVS